MLAGRRQRLLGPLAEALRVVHAGREVAVHAREAGRRQRVVDTAHFEGVAGFRSRIIRLPEPRKNRRCCGHSPSTKP